MKVGAPYSLSNPEDLKSKIEKYFSDCDKRTEKVTKITGGKAVSYDAKVPYTIEGLALAIGVDMSTVWRYAQFKGDRDVELCKIIQEAVLKVRERYMICGLLGVFDTTFATFIAKCSFNIKDNEDEKEGGENPTDSRKEKLEENLKIAREAEEKSYPKDNE